LRQKFLIIHNSGSGWQGRGHYEDTLARLRQAGAELKIVEFPPRAKGQGVDDKIHLPDDIRAGEYDAVVAAGGDGAIHAVAGWLLGSDTPLAIIPLGTGNVLARELGVKKSAEALVDMLRRGPVKNMPVGMAGERIFLFVVGIGFDAQVVHYFEQGPNRRFGRAGYVLPVLQALGAKEGPPLSVIANNRTLAAHWVIVTRIQHYAANFILAPDADPFEAAFHVVCFRGAGALVRLRQLTALFSGLAAYDPGIEIIRATEAKITGDSAASVQIDGEIMGALPLHIRPHKQSLPIILPTDC